MQNAIVVGFALPFFVEGQAIRTIFPFIDMQP